MQEEIKQYISVILKEWQPLRAELPQNVIVILRNIAEEQSDNLAHRFYESLFKDPAIARHLSYELVEEQLSRSLSKWVKAILTQDESQFETLAQQQYHVGGVHARIGIPVEFVQRGARQLKYGIYDYITQHNIETELGLQVMHYAAMAIDIAIEMMSHAYAMSHYRATRNEEAYRMHVLMNNAWQEQGKQQSALSSWENSVIYGLVSGVHQSEALIKISDSNFGLWFRHKCVRQFGETEQIQQIRLLMTTIDQKMASLDITTDIPVEKLQDLLRIIHACCQKISTYMEMLFNDVSHMQDGKDALTNLLNKRYLPIVLKHEVSLAMENHLPLSVAIIDVDFFKKVNDEWGHTVGDRALTHVANLLSDNIRASDYVFRYGGEEFLIVLVEAGQSEAYMLLERIRRIVSSTPFEAVSGKNLPITVSIGYTVHDGHPDYNQLLNRADVALYEAKRNGRNRIEQHK
ncbi:diguanylate cyclase [Pantoea phytobeneficialis]|uniref:Diguanylate cyclase DosC n=1 Tax=Pantoea phytobeneficialis TaxID=2052056 RepID=A0AAP9KSE3_9GAMM|nr:diguanylate cyclase [Pantoea phytobeneficialis]MDO6407024.1 diguanylate cyclase [Pantoea phytobeneficialis]QGR09988.1 diguanylate cyclase [Pantoea phytobeneficialis]